MVAVGLICTTLPSLLQFLNEAQKYEQMLLDAALFKKGASKDAIEYCGLLNYVFFVYFIITSNVVALIGNNCNVNRPFILK